MPNIHTLSDDDLSFFHSHSICGCKTEDLKSQFSPAYSSTKSICFIWFAVVLAAKLRTQIQTRIDINAKGGQSTGYSTRKTFSEKGYARVGGSITECRGESDVQNNREMEGGGKECYTVRTLFFMSPLKV